MNVLIFCEKVKFKNPSIIIAKLVAAGLLLGALGHQQYDYYTLMRWAVCGVSAFAAFQAFKIKRTGWLWTFAIIAAAFNPWIPMHLKRETWAIIDFAVAVLFLTSIAILDRHSAPQ